MNNKVIKLAAMLSAMPVASLLAQQVASSSMYMQKGTLKSVAVPFQANANISEYMIPAEPVKWGMDVAWNWDVNVLRGTNYIGKDVLKIGRVSFQPSDLVDANGNLSTAQRNTLQSRLDNIRLSGVKDIVINCDHEVLCNKDSYPNADQNYANYHGKPQNWVNVIKATVKYCQSKGFNVITVSPFNEPDYTSWKEGSQADFKEIARLITEDPFFANIRISAGNTLNCDQALSWYNYMKPYVTEGNTHQLAGSMANYTKFWRTVRNDGNYATADELHNTMEAFIGIHHGMQSGIWWGMEGASRGEFCKASAYGKEIGYAEDASTWTGAAVYKWNRKKTASDETTEERINVFAGASERQAKPCTYDFITTDRPVYFEGYGPVYSYEQYIPSDPNGTYGSTLQKNAERMMGVQYGEDVPTDYINSGIYTISNANARYCLSYASATSTLICLRNYATYPLARHQWLIEPVPVDGGGDFGYVTLRNPDATDGKYLNTSEEWAVGAGKGLTYRTNWASSGRNHFFFEYAGDNYWYIRNRYTGLYLQVKGAATSLNATIVMEEFTGKPEQKWRFIPVDANDVKATGKLEFDAPSTPTGVRATRQSASVLLSWNANADADVAGYNILRAAVGSADEWDVIGRVIKDTVFIDNDLKPGVTYNYKVRAIDRSRNLSEASATVESAPLKKATHLVARYSFDNTANDTTENQLHALVAGAGEYKTPYTKQKEGTTCLYLNGTSDYIVLPPSAGNMSEMTIAMWVYNGSASTTWSRIFDFGNGTDQYFFLSPNNGSNMRLAIKNGGAEQTLSAAKLTTGWHHVAVTLAPDSVTLYVDGNQKATTTSITLRPSDISPKKNYIGRSQFAADPLLKGYIDDVRIYDSALTTDQVVTIMNGGDIADAVKGDVNGDGTVDVADINAIISVICGTSTASTADVNNDGTVDVADINAVISIICGNPTQN